MENSDSGTSYTYGCVRIRSVRVGVPHSVLLPALPTEGDWRQEEVELVPGPGFSC